VAAAPPGFALGRFLIDGRPALGPVAGEQVLPLPTGGVSVLLSSWSTEFTRLAQLAQDPGGSGWRPLDGLTVEQVRAEAAATMDRRAAQGEHYLFAGLPSAVAGPYDDVVLPGYSEQHAGNGLVHGRLLRPGDVMEGTITGPGIDLGTQRTRCVADDLATGAAR
jgi:hypothetical protein